MRLPTLASSRVALVAAALFGAPASAQEAVETIPVALARALTDGFGSGMPGDEARFVVGRLPEGVPAEAIPVGAVVTGGMASGMRATAVAVVRGGDYRSTLAAIGERLRGASWEPSARRSMSVFDAQMSARFGESGPPSSFCKDGTSLILNLSAVPSRDASLRVDVNRGSAAFDCRGVGAARLVSGVPLPEMTAPTGAMLDPSGSSSSQDHFESRTLVETSLDLAALVEHYATQLVKHGWVAGERTSCEGVATRALHFQDARGRTWHGAVVVTVIPGRTARELALFVEREGRVRLRPMRGPPTRVP